MKKIVSLILVGFITYTSVFAIPVSAENTGYDVCGVFNGTSHGDLQCGSAVFKASAFSADYTPKAKDSRTKLTELLAYYSWDFD